jgi:LacI family transcriptional regulator
MATIKDVSKRTGLSLATISKYLNGGHVLDENRAAIEAAVLDLGYSVDSLARSLKTRRSMTVGVLIPDLENVFCTGIVSSLENRLQPQGYSTIVCDYRSDAALEVQKLEFLSSRSIDGLVLMPLQGATDGIRRLQDRGVPVVLIDRPVPGIACDAVLADNLNAVYGAVERLVVAGHRRIGIVGGPKGIHTAEERLKGYLRVHEDYRLPVDPALVRYGDYDVESGHRLARELLDLPVPPTALFVTNHEMTFGAVLALNERGVRIPEALSFTGFDFRDLAVLHRPSLSIVVQPLRQIGETVADLLLRRMGGDASGFPALHRLKTELLPGASVAPPAVAPP